MGEYTNLSDVHAYIKNYLDDPNHVNISVIFANNTSGKTRLSKLFCDDADNSVLCYNAFLEDCFSWDNDNVELSISKGSWVSDLIKDEGLHNEIDSNFKLFTNGRIEATINSTATNVVFKLLGDDESKDNIKISKGEESLFIWSVFYTVLQTAIDNLIETIDNRTSEKFNDLRYIVIDDPVSSMDDARIISVGIAINELLDRLVKSQDKLQTKIGVLITTHHALFFSIIHNKNIKADKRKQQDYVLSRLDKTYILEEQNNSSPFAYHHQILLEIQHAIKEDDIRKYHFNLLRCLLEKTANFLGYKGNWSVLISDNSNKELLIKILNQYSHNQLSETEARYVEKNDKDLFINTFNDFLRDYKWNY